MRFGTVLPERGPLAQPDQLSALARRAEESGFYAVEFGDHIVIPRKIESTYPYTETGVAPNWDGWLEQVTTLSFLAAKTTRLHLVTSVMVLPYRHPLLAAKMLASLDVLSGGRLILGVGAGWMKEEFEALGLLSFGERGAVCSEDIGILREIWTSENPSFRGKFFSFGALKLGPLPVQKPHPPIWVGGESEAALRRAAALGDAWYPIGGNPKRPLKTLSQLREAISELNACCRSAGRHSTLPVNLVASQLRLEEGITSDELFVGDSEKVVSDIHDCERLGVSYVSFDFLGQDIDETLHAMDGFAKRIIGHG